MSLADYHVLNAFVNPRAPGGRLQVSEPRAALIGLGTDRPRGRIRLRRLCERGLAGRVPSQDDGRATDATPDKGGSAKAIDGGSSASRGP